MNTYEYTNAIMYFTKSYEADTLKIFDEVIMNMSSITFDNYQTEMQDDMIIYDILPKNYIKLIKNINECDYKKLFDLMTFIDKDNIEQGLVWHEQFVYYVLEEYIPIGINYIMETDFLNTNTIIDFFFGYEKRYINFIKYIKNTYTTYSNQPFFTNHFYPEMIYTYIADMKAGFTKKIVYTIANIGGIINKSILDYTLINNTEFCDENYKRINSKRFKYDRFCNIYNLYRKVFI